MKYMILIHETASTREQFMADDSLMGRMDALIEELTRTGELVGGDALADPSQGHAIRVRNGETAVTDGPFAEAKEYVGGTLIIDCESPDRALEIAKQFPQLEIGGLELRPIMDSAGNEM